MNKHDKTEIAQMSRDRRQFVHITHGSPMSPRPPQECFNSHGTLQRELGTKSVHNNVEDEGKDHMALELINSSLKN